MTASSDSGPPSHVHVRSNPFRSPITTPRGSAGPHSIDAGIAVVSKEGFLVSKERVERLVRENGIRARHKRRYKAATDSKHGLPVAPNVLDRDFTPAAPNQVWTADLMYIWTDAGWLYLAVVLGLFNREVVCWSIKPRTTTDIAVDALTMAWFRRKPAPGLIRHSDRGSQQCVPGQAHRVRHDMLDEPQRKLLGQCADGELFQQAEERTSALHSLRHARRGTCRFVRLHRGPLQPESSSLHAWLPGSDPVSAALDRDSDSAKLGGLRLYPC